MLDNMELMSMLDEKSAKLNAVEIGSNEQKERLFVLTQENKRLLDLNKALKQTLEDTKSLFFERTKPETDIAKRSEILRNARITLF